MGEGRLAPREPASLSINWAREWRRVLGWPAARAFTNSTHSRHRANWGDGFGGRHLWRRLDDYHEQYHSRNHARYGGAAFLATDPSEPPSSRPQYGLNSFEQTVSGQINSLANNLVRLI